jgi:hypothetical protein
MEDHMSLSEMAGDTPLSDLPDDEPWDASAIYTLDDVKRLLKRQYEQIQELRTEARDEKAMRYRAETELRAAREQLQREGSVRPSLEVLQRMANGLDPFDIGRFKCAMAALPHETPKLSQNVSVVGSMGLGARLDRLNGKSGDALDRLNKRGMRVIEGEPAP